MNPARPETRLLSRPMAAVLALYGKLEQQEIEQVLPLEPERWGVWAVWFPHPMRTRADVRNNLATVLPDLKARWEEWKRSFSHLPR